MLSDFSEGISPKRPKIFSYFIRLQSTDRFADRVQTTNPLIRLVRYNARRCAR